MSSKSPRAQDEFPGLLSGFMEAKHCGPSAGDDTVRQRADNIPMSQG